MRAAARATARATTRVARVVTTAGPCEVERSELEGQGVTDSRMCVRWGKGGKPKKLHPLSEVEWDISMREFSFPAVTPFPVSLRFALPKSPGPLHSQRVHCVPSAMKRLKPVLQSAASLSPIGDFEVCGPRAARPGGPAALIASLLLFSQYSLHENGFEPYLYLPFNSSLHI